jgi:hypothetical protein
MLGASLFDDRRPAPAGWVRVRTSEEAIELLRAGGVDELSHDHDLGLVVGPGERTGYDVLLWLEAEVAAGRAPAAGRDGRAFRQRRRGGADGAGGRVDPAARRRGARRIVNADRGARPADFLWLLLPLAVLAASRKGAVPAGLAVGFALYVVGPLLGGLIMLAKGRSVRAGLLVAALFPVLGLIALLGLENRR